MATATEQKPAGATQPPAERLIDRLNRALNGVRDTIERALPDEMKPHIDRIIQRAVLSFKMGSEKLQKSTIASFVECVVEAASLGLMIDNKLAYAVPYDCKVTVNGRDTWETRAKCMVSYIGLYIVAKRSGQIKHAAAELVCANDHFDIFRQGPVQHLEHRQPPFGKDRGELLGGYAVVEFPDRSWSYITMTIEEIHSIRMRSKAKDKGPWVTDTAEMQRKTLLRRALKLHCSDPIFIKAEQLDEAHYEHEDLGSTAQPASRATRSDLNEQLGIPAPRARSQFEQDMEGGPQHAAERETVEASRPEPAEEQQFHHTDPEEELPGGDGPLTDGGDFAGLMKELAVHLNAAKDLKTIQASREWAMRQLPRALDESEQAEVGIACDEARDRVKGARGSGSNKQGTLMDTNENAGQ